MRRRKWFRCFYNMIWLTRNCVRFRISIYFEISLHILIGQSYVLCDQIFFSPPLPLRFALCAHIRLWLCDCLSNNKRVCMISAIIMRNKRNKTVHSETSTGCIYDENSTAETENMYEGRRWHGIETVTKRAHHTHIVQSVPSTRPISIVLRKEWYYGNTLRASGWDVH